MAADRTIRKAFKRVGILNKVEFILSLVKMRVKNGEIQNFYLFYNNWCSRFLKKKKKNLEYQASSFKNRWGGTFLRAVAVTCYLPSLGTESGRAFPLLSVPITMASTEIPRQAVSSGFYSGCRRQKKEITPEHAWYHQQCKNYINGYRKSAWLNRATKPFHKPRFNEMWMNARIMVIISCTNTQ